MKTRLLLITLLMTAHAFAGHHFHASATALTIEGANATMEQGVVNLRASGGESTTSMGHYEDADVRFESAVSEVSGMEKDGIAYTVSTVTIRDLNVRNILHAGEITLRISGRHRSSEAEAEISFEGSEYRNLTINGRPLDLELSFDRYAELPTFERIKRDVAERHNLWNDGPSGTVRERAHSLYVEGLGTIYFGEVTARFGERSLAMLRIDLEDRVTNRRQPRRARTLVIAGGEGNGSNPYPP